MLNKNIIRLILIVLLICITATQVQPIPSGISYNFMNISYCYGNAEVMIRTGLNVSDFTFIGCGYSKDNLWLCKCRNPTTLSFNSLNTTKGELDITVQYNIERPLGNEIEQDNVRRTKQFTGIKIKPEPKLFVWPAFNIGGKLVIGVIIIIGLALLFGVYVLIKRLFFTDNDEIKGKYTDEEMVEWLNDLEKR